MQISTQLLFFLSRKYPKRLRQKRYFQIARPPRSPCLTCHIQTQSPSTQGEISSRGNNAPSFSDFVFLPQVYLKKCSVLQSEVHQVQWSVEVPGEGPPGTGELRAAGATRILETCSVWQAGESGKRCGPCTRVTRQNSQSTAAVLNPNDVTSPLSPKPLFIRLISAVCLTPLTCWVL